MVYWTKFDKGYHLSRSFFLQILSDPSEIVKNLLLLLGNILARILLYTVFLSFGELIQGYLRGLSSADLD